MACKERSAQIETMLREWLEEPAITLVCGDWRNGSIMEILPEGRAILTPQKYPEPFSGLRDIALPGQAHHLHLDLDKIERVVYAITSCVCYGYRPSFDVRFGDAQGNTIAFALSVRQPYVGRKPNKQALASYFRRMLDHHQRFPEITRCHVESPHSNDSASADGWDEILSCFLEATGLDRHASFNHADSEVFHQSVRSVLEVTQHA